jgi:hypothetical protein
MEQAESKKSRKNELVLMVMVLLIVLPAFAWAQPYMQSSDSLIKLVLRSKFEIDYTTASIDAGYYQFKKNNDTAFCISEKGHPFNETDVHKGGMCDRRLVLYGKNMSYPGLSILLYEIDHGGGPGKSCDVFVTLNGRVKRVITIDLANQVKNVSELKSYLRRHKFALINDEKVQ